MGRKTLISIGFVLAVVAAGSTRGEILSGKVNIYGCGFDFSTQECSNDINSVDVALGVDGCWFPATCYVEPYSMVVVITGKTLGDVCGPPENPLWGCGGFIDDCPQGGEVYVIHTKDGYWGKFAFTQPTWPSPANSEILYFVQTDGTSNLCPVPVESNTWGEIKALYE
jgi:hypothetical protein